MKNSATKHAAFGNHDFKKVVEPLVKALASSGRSYVAATERSSNEHLKKVFREIAERRQWFGAQLQVLVEDESAPPRSFTGTLHEWWMTLRDQLSEDDHGLLAELERSEDSMLVRYEKALAQDGLPPRLRRTLEEQRKVVEDTHDHVRLLRDSEKAARQA